MDDRLSVFPSPRRVLSDLSYKTHATEHLINALANATISKKCFAP